MDYKSSGAFLILMISVLTAMATNKDNEFPMCIEYCMPLCMKVKTATSDRCTVACKLGCDQLMGRGEFTRRD
ncbi:hypothetical protein SLEP1_g39107 [Rubroshorea leprosula]|uniref:Plant thionin family protein n=1 Tax=Rubroshorea leprosula TaxID=152421 RepID=A0AAV5KZ65_9ROSI|nr:hypothetical protein SLEP1_g39107 [Rubroshorea leprosula]